MIVDKILYNEQPECDVCGNRPNNDGVLEHGRGCYTQSEDGGGTEYFPEYDYGSAPELEGGD